MSASATGRRGPRRWLGTAVARWPLLVDLYRFARHPGWERAVRRDLRRTGETSAVLRFPPSPTDAPTVLVGLYREDVFDAKLAMVLASALRAKGARTVVLAPSWRNHRIRRYAAAFGFDAVTARDQVTLPEAEVAALREAARRLCAGPTDLETVRQWTHDGSRVGYHILSTLIRRTFDGSPDLHVDATRGLLFDITSEVLTTYAICARVLDDVDPSHVLVDEANYAVNGPLVDVAVARAIDVVQTVTTWRDDALISKRLGPHNRRVDAKSVAPETLVRLDGIRGFPPPSTLDAELDDDFARRYGGTWVLGTQNQSGTRPFGRDEIIEHIGLDRHRRTAVVFAHVLWDASLFYGTDLFENYTDWLRETVRAAAANPHVNWVIKTHPSNVFRVAHGDIAAGASSEWEIVRDALPELPPHLFVLPPDTPMDTTSLYAFADYGVTVRGTPGLEMACFGKHVITAGTGAYSGLGFTLDSASVAEYLGRLASIHEFERPDDAVRIRARRYAYALFLRRPWAPTSFHLRFDFPDHGRHPLDRNVEWSVGSVEQLVHSPDLGPWVDWVLTARDDDFLAPVAPGAPPVPRAPVAPTPHAP